MSNFLRLGRNFGAYKTQGIITSHQDLHFDIRNYRICQGFTIQNLCGNMNVHNFIHFFFLQNSFNYSQVSKFNFIQKLKNFY